MAMEFEPGAGAGIEFTDNAKMTRDNRLSDQIATAYIGARLADNKGYSKYDVKTSINKHTYLQDSFADQQYFYLAARANWEMVPEQFNWIVSDTFSQRLFNTLDPNTPDNLQDTNVFRFGARINTATRNRHVLSLYPLFTQYYYEDSPINNKQYSVTADYFYKMYPTVDMGLSLGARKVDYTDDNITDTEFATADFIIEGQRVTSEYLISLGVVNVKRDFFITPDQDDTRFSGSLRFSNELSSRSSFNLLLSSNVTDTSSVSSIQGTGHFFKKGEKVYFQIDEITNIDLTADVIRNNVIYLSYNRADEELRSSIWTGYSEVKYTTSGSLSPPPNDRIQHQLGFSLDYPMTQLLYSGAYFHYSRVEEVDSSPYREDEHLTIGAKLKYRMSPNLHSSLDLKYRTKDSTLDSENFDEVSFFANLVYGFSSFFRPTRYGGY